MFPLRFPTLADGLDGGSAWDSMQHLGPHWDLSPAPLTQRPFWQRCSLGQPRCPHSGQPLQRAISQGTLTGKLSSSPVNCYESSSLHQFSTKAGKADLCKWG